MAHAVDKDAEPHPGAEAPSAGAAKAAEEPWVRDFLFTWISRFGLFFAFHQTQPLFAPHLKDLGASATTIGLVMSAFTLAATLIRLPMGLLVDRYTRKLLLVLGLVGFGLSALGYWWGPTILLIALFRVVQGFSWSASTTAIGTLAADIAPARRRGELIGYAGTASNLGGALGPVLGFALVYEIGFRGVFLVTLVPLAISLAVSLAIRERRRVAHHHPGPPRTGFVSVMLVKEALPPALTASFLTFCLGGVNTFAPLYALHIGLSNPGIYFAFYALSLLLSRPIAGPLSDRFSRRAVIIPAYLLYLVGMLVLAFSRTPELMLLSAVLSGLGFGAAHPALMTLAVDNASAARRGLSMAQFQLFYDGGIGVGSLFLGILLDQLHDDYSTMFLVATVVAALGLVYYLRQGPERRMAVSE